MEEIQLHGLAQRLVEKLAGRVAVVLREMGQQLPGGELTHGFFEHTVWSHEVQES